MIMKILNSNDQQLLAKSNNNVDESRLMINHLNN